MPLKSGNSASNQEVFLSPGPLAGGGGALYESMTNPLESATSSSKIKDHPQDSGWLKVSAVAAASALLGGLAAAWFYRKTLHKLRQAESHGADSEFRIPNSDSDEDT
jgi:hypothetical protein